MLEYVPYCNQQNLLVHMDVNVRANSPNMYPSEDHKTISQVEL